MNLRRREEIREMIAEIESSVLDGSATVRDLCTLDAMRELLAHIDTLEQTAAERVIADGSRGPTPDYTGEGSAWVPPVEAPAVVVPELPTWEDGENKLRRGEKLTALEKFVMDHDWHKTDTTFRDGLEAVFAELRANQGGAAK